MVDLVLKNGLVADGTGAPAVKADVCVRDGRIAEICTEYEGEAARVIDCSGLVVAPGFIDMHSHSDVCAFGDEFPDGKILQGVTTEICGNCGTSAIGVAKEDHADNAGPIWSLLDSKPGKYGDGCYDSLADYKAAVEKLGYPSNIAMLAGHGPIRSRVLGNESREPNDAELSEMCSVLDSLLKEGAFGLSLGLIYPPGSFSKSGELTTLAKVCAANGVPVTVHMRSEGLQIMEALEEMLGVAKEAGARLQVSHIKILTKSLWGKSKAITDRICAARAEGLTVYCDQYPFTASNTVVAALLPRKALAGSKLKILFRLLFPNQKLLQGIDEMIAERGGPEAVLINQTGGKLPEYEGKTLAAIAEEAGCSPAKLVTKIVLKTFSASQAFYFSISEEDVLHFMKQPFVCVGSDGVAYSYAVTADKIPHPRNLSTFPEFIRTVREKELLPLSETVRKMTGLTAEIIGLTDRGTLTPGKAADITVFRYENAAGRDLYEKGPSKPEGIAYVFVNGVAVVEQGTVTGAKPGKVLLKGRDTE